MVYKKATIFISLALCAFEVLARADDESVYRKRDVDSIVLHAIGGPYCKSGQLRFSGAAHDGYFWRSFFERDKVLGIHYIVDREGLVLSSVTENKIANHTRGWNQRSIGIELVNKGDGVELVTKKQWLALKKLVNEVVRRHELLNKRRVFRHSDLDMSVFNCAGVEIRRKMDPGAAFNYARFISELD